MTTAGPGPSSEPVPQSQVTIDLTDLSDGDNNKDTDTPEVESRDSPVPIDPPTTLAPAAQSRGDPSSSSFFASFLHPSHSGGFGISPTAAALSKVGLSGRTSVSDIGDATARSGPSGENHQALDGQGPARGQVSGPSGSQLASSSSASLAHSPSAAQTYLASSSTTHYTHPQSTSPLSPSRPPLPATSSSYTHSPGEVSSRTDPTSGARQAQGAYPQANSLDDDDDVVFTKATPPTRRMTANLPGPIPGTTSLPVPTVPSVPMVPTVPPDPPPAASYYPGAFGHPNTSPNASANGNPAGHLGARPTQASISAQLAQASAAAAGAAGVSGFAGYARGFAPTVNGAGMGGVNGVGVGAFGAGAGGMFGAVRPPVVPSMPTGLPAGLPPGTAAAGSSTDGSSRAAAIDVDAQESLPRRNPKKPICIGAFMTRALMLYPVDAAVVGNEAPPGTKPWDVVTWRGAEMIHVKLKLRRAGTPSRPDEPWSNVSKDTIQVVTTGHQVYIGDLDPHIADNIITPLLQRGLCRLEGFALRLLDKGPAFEIRVNVMVFTLPSNVRYISDTLTSHMLFLLDPVPPYDPNRHGDCPDYVNAHGSGEHAQRLYLQQRANQAFAGGAGGFHGMGPFGAIGVEAQRARQIEVQREQVDEVFKSIGNGLELDQSDPGPWIKTNLFPHQRKALTFLLHGEQDWTSLKEARKRADKLLKASAKKKKDSGEMDVEAENATSNGDAANGNGEASNGDTAPEEQPKGKERSQSRDLKDDNSRSLWEGERDEKGRLRIWKNKITGEKMRLKKGERPHDTKGAILADDMGLGKTLSVVSLIAATRSAAREWSQRPLEKTDIPTTEPEEKPKLTMASMSTKVFGMPEEDAADVKSKKRRRDDKEDTSLYDARRATIVKRSKATLLVCPMSTITNWEDQIKEHWDGKVEVVTAGGGPAIRAKKVKDDPVDEDDLLRVYIYHGTSRRADPRYLAEFDIVITSYSTLANEYSKQCATCGDEDTTPAETGANTDDETTTQGTQGTQGETSRSGVDSGAVTSSGVKTETENEIKPHDIVEALKKKGRAPRRKINADQPSPLQSIDWFRVVLDEAHSIKSSATMACKASCYLEADRRIALTGTPIQNKIEDVWALFKFLRLSPVDSKETFTKYITTPCKTGEQVGIARLQLVMRACTLRRTKETQENGRKILQLPPRKEMQLWLKLRPDERKIYDERLKDAKREVDDLMAQKQLTKNYAHVLQNLLRLRQTCDHVDLPHSGVAEEDYDGTIMPFDDAVAALDKDGLSQTVAASIICSFKDTSDGAVCSQCGHDFGPYFPSIGLGGDVEAPTKPELLEKKGKKALSRPILTKCQHIHCLKCFKSAVYSTYPRNIKNQSRQCGVCSFMLRLERDVLEVAPPGDPDEPPKRTVSRRKWKLQPGEELSLSTKMSFLQEELMTFSRRNKYSKNWDPYAVGSNENDEPLELDADGFPLIVKSVVFSQWTTMLDRIEEMLKTLDIGYCRLDGSMTREARADAMEELRTKKKVEVMLVSTRAGGVGLNLTTATRAYLVDPYWNPSVEAQAIDRLHRLGQTRPVTAIKLMIDDSVEKKLAEIQKKKADLANLSLKNMSRKELLEQKAEELANLFK